MVIIYTTPTGKTTVTTCLPVDDKFRKTEFKKQVLEQTDYVELMEYLLIGLVILDILAGFYSHYVQRINAVQQLAALEGANNTPQIQRRNSMALLRVADS